MPRSSTTINAASVKFGASCYRHGMPSPGMTASPGRTNTLNRSTETRRPTINDELTEGEIGKYFDLSNPEPQQDIAARAEAIKRLKDEETARARERMAQYQERLDRLQPQADAQLEPDTQAIIREVCDDLRDFLLDKNAQYGDSAIDPVRIFSKAAPIEQLLVRIDDKLSRIQKGDDRIESDDDVIDDLIGYFILLKVAKIKGRN